MLEATAPNGNATGKIMVTTPYGTASGSNTITVNEDVGIRGTFTGIDLNDQAIKLEIYPNPASNYLYVNSSMHNELRFDLYDLAGQLVLSGNANEKINLSEINNGLYLIRVKSLVNAPITRKILVQKSPE